MVGFRRRIMGQRRTILGYIQEGTYGEWLVQQALDQQRQLQVKIKLFRERWIGNRRLLPVDAEFDLSVSALAPRDLYGTWTKDQRLWAAVLIRAIYDLVHFYLDPKGKSQSVNQTRLGLESRNWFSSTRTDVGSFRWICHALEIHSYEKMRDLIFSKTREDLPRQCSSRKKK